MHAGLNMNLQPIPYLLIIVLVFSLPVIGSTPPEINISERSEVAFRFRPGSSDHLNNYFVKEIARYNFLNLYTTEYIIDFELLVMITENDRGGYMLQADVKNPKMKGDIYYKDFDLSGVLLPSSFEFNLLASNKSQSKTLNFQGMNLDSENTVEFELHALSNVEHPEFSVLNIDFRYNDADRLKFEKRIAGINHYLAYSEMLDLNLEKAGGIHPQTRDSILPVFVQIFDIERFKNRLSMMEPDFPVPASYQQKMKNHNRKLDAFLRRANTLFFRNIDTLKPIIGYTQLVNAAEMLVQLQKEYLAAMRNTSHHYEPAYLEVMEFFGDKPGWYDLASRLEGEILPEAMIYDDTEIISDFTKILYQRYARECDTLIAREEFNEAEIFAIHAKTFCNLLPDNDCGIITFNRLSQTKYGIFDSYLRVAHSAMENQNLPFSLKYLKLAQAFQTKNSRFIISRVAVDNALEELAWAFLKHGENMYETEDFSIALESYTTSREIYVELSIANYLNLLDKQIGRCVEKMEAAVRGNE